MPENESVQGTGAFDGGAGKFTSTTTLTSPKHPSSTERIVLDADYYQREPGRPWVHLDLGRVKKDSPYHFDRLDPIGLAKFAGAITYVTRTNPTTYTGRFRPDSGDDPFLPIGAPSLWAVGLPVSPFTLTVDDRGRVTSISVELTPADSPTLTMTTTLSAHGEPLNLSAPDAQEADETYYD
ncbi:hypothetical protein GCM10020369_27760 [Cryptosporangium minutisporangium]|uniref:F5/8 type C domain-containing protein n=1 Tax=Cryptosporangium minutisporangium TaxID=113569 RepID=A0ABP6SXA8_9ACTN